MDEKRSRTSKHEGQPGAEHAPARGGLLELFDAPFSANRALEFLLELGYEPREIGIMVSEDTRERCLHPTRRAAPPAGPGRGARDAAHDRLAAEAVAHALRTAQPMSPAWGGAVGTAGALSAHLVAASAAAPLATFGILLLGPFAGLSSGASAGDGGARDLRTPETGHAALLHRYGSEVLRGKVLLHVQPRGREHELAIRREWELIRSAAA